MMTESEPTPQFRSASLRRPPAVSRLNSSGHNSGKPMRMSSHNINNSMAQNQSSKRTNPSSSRAVTNWSVSDTHVRHIPSFYPLETSSRSVHDTPANIASRISDCCRLLSVHAEYNDELATAELKTEDHVEIHVTLWNGDEPEISSNHSNSSSNALSEGKEDASAQVPKPIKTTIIEAQRRKGCAVTYHRYCRNLLDAAAGNFIAPVDARGNVDVECQPKQVQYPRLELKRNDGRGHLKSGLESAPRPSVSGIVLDDSEPEPAENSLLALEIAASLLAKDRIDARRLGMESLCLLTDPTKTGMDTAVLASQLVLFGSIRSSSPDQNTDDDDVGVGEFAPDGDELGIREAILSLVQFGKLGDCYGDLDSDDDDVDGNGNKNGEVEDEFNQILHNLALAVLANALEVLELHGKQTSGLMGSTIASASNASLNNGQMPCANTFLEESKEMTNRELLSSLLNVLGKAESKPHDACLSAQCLRSLFQASKEAKKKAKELNAKQIVMTALDVGQRTHVKLEKETQNIIRVLERSDTDMDGGHRSGGGGSVIEQEPQQHEGEENEDDEDSKPTHRHF